MNFLFVHNNFPAQYKHIAARFAADPANRVVAVGCPTAQDMKNIKLYRYDIPPVNLVQTHPFARRFDFECRRAEQVLYTLAHIAKTGFVPDLIMVHSGWGENLPVRAVFPNARVIVYCEFFYRPHGQDVNFDPEFPPLTLDGVAGLAAKNANLLLGLADADAGLAPTRWQRSTFPREMQSKIAVIHEGIDTAVIKPDPTSFIVLPGGKRLRKGDDVVTFVCRNIEPLRGFHTFMRALPRIMRERPNAEVLVIGGNGISYGHAPPDGQTWKDVFLAEVAKDIDLARVHFLGQIRYDQYLHVLQISAVHVYLTYPFVLSWSLMEAMSAECTIVASDVAPVQELVDETTGLLVPFLEPDIVARRVVDVLSQPRHFASLGATARRRIVRDYDAKSVCLPAVEAFMLSTMR